ncbi:MAG TPA: DUF2277 family protein [Actinomycetota bacterium]|nr:DUF2277 family protein [Actinomycetota bacterium]
MSGYREPSKANREAFERSVDEIAGSTTRLLSELAAAPAKQKALL